MGVKFPPSPHRGRCSAYGGKASVLRSSEQGQRSLGCYFPGCLRELSLVVVSFVALVSQINNSFAAGLGRGMGGEGSVVPLLL